MRVAVAFTLDDSYVTLLGNALRSMFENKKGDYLIDVYIIGDISTENKQRLSSIERQFRFSLVYVKPDRKLFEGLPVTRLPVYYRLAIGTAIPDCKRVVYLDCDVMVKGDIAELYNIDLHGKVLGAASDCLLLKLQPDRWKHLRGLLTRDVNTVYFNSGVLVIDLDLWRAKGMEERLISFAKKNHERVKFRDQDVLNIVFLEEDWQELPAKYNSLVDDVDAPLIIHYAGRARPYSVSVTVLFCSDDHYAGLLTVALVSLCENKRGNYSLHVFIVDGGLSTKHVDNLHRLQRYYGFTLTLIVPDYAYFEAITAKLAMFRENYKGGRITGPALQYSVAAFYRLAVAHFLPQDCKRVVYLDCDVMVKGDIAELYNIDLHGKVLGAARDYPFDSQGHFIRLLGQVLKAVYFNSGVLVIDLDLWRAKGIESILFKYTYNNISRLLLADQDALNVTFLNNFQEIPLRYNYMPVRDNLAGRNNLFIVHFAGCHPTSGARREATAGGFRVEYGYYTKKASNLFRNVHTLPANMSRFGGVRGIASVNV